MEARIKLLRITTVPISLNILLKGQLAYVHSSGFEVVTASADGPEIAEMVKREGVIHHILPLTRKITPFQDLICLWKLVRFMKKEKIQMVHSHTPKAGLLGMMAAQICGVPYRLHTVAGMPLMEATGFKRKVLKMTERITYWSATRVYPNSFKLMDFIALEISDARDKFHVIGKGSSNGIDTSHFQATEEISAQSEELRNQYGITKDHLVLIFVGRIVSDKGVNELVNAFEKVHAEKNKPIKLILVGPYEDDLNPVSPKTRHTIETHPDIITVGFQKDIRPYLQLSDIFVFPSYREGFPNVILQACAMGIPCIASDINGCNEIITHGETGLLVPPKNVDELAKSMSRMISDETLRNSFSEKAKKHVVTHYDQQRVWEQIIAEYKRMINV